MCNENCSAYKQNKFLNQFLMKNKKIELRKKVISSLSDADQRQVVGGVEPLTTSNSDCTHFLCCKDDCVPPPGPFTSYVAACNNADCPPPTPCDTVGPKVSGLPS